MFWCLMSLSETDKTTIGIQNVADAVLTTVGHCVLHMHNVFTILHLFVVYFRMPNLILLSGIFLHSWIHFISQCMRSQWIIIIEYGRCKTKAQTHKMESFNIYQFVEKWWICPNFLISDHKLSYVLILFSFSSSIFHFKMPMSAAN